MIRHIINIILLFIFIFAGLLASCSDDTKLPALSKDATILAFGDSLTYGTGTSSNNAYPAALQRLLQRTVINAGIPGEISSKGLARLPALIEKYQPALIIICHGGNDILRKLNLSETSDNIQRMIDLAKSNNSAVILIGVPQFGLFFNSAAFYEELAEKNNIPISNDILGDIISNNSLKSDRIHPNSQGYQILAEDISSLLQRHGAIPGR
ncbi:MAG: arylesterase [Gammaproteobacteria bacterium]|nr:arylesterase [Gammaproteobacteria bacterium]